MESTKKVTIKQLNSLQEKSKIYLAGAGRGNTKVGGPAHACHVQMGCNVYSMAVDGADEQGLAGGMCMCWMLGSPAHLAHRNWMLPSSNPRPTNFTSFPRRNTSEVRDVGGWHLYADAHHTRVTALKNAVHPAKPRREVQYLIVELLKRLYTANDWVVRGPTSPPQ